jgi:hypothetical protein
MTQKYAKIFNLQTKNDFAANFNQITESNDFQNLNDKFTVKPFFVKYKAFKRFLNVFSYLIHCITIAVSFICVVALLTPLMPAVAAYLLSFVVLVLIESLKRFTFSPTVTEWLQFRAVAYFQICLCVVAMSASVYLTYKGGHDTVFTLSTKPIFINSDSLTSSDKSRITTLTNQLGEIKRLQSWNGKLTPKGAKNYEKVLSQLETIEKRVSAKEDRATSSNDKILSDHQSTTESRAVTFRYVTVLLDFLLLIFLAWLEYYDFRSYTEFATINETTDKNTAEPPPASKKDITYNYNALRNNDNGTATESRAVAQNLSVKSDVSVQKRNYVIIACQHCKNDYERKTTFQKYCSEKCRITAWEQRNGTTLRTKNKF